MTVRKPFGKDVAPDAVRMHLCDTNPKVVDPWIWAFRESDAVEVLEGSLLDQDADCALCPANSFGDMSGGADKIIDDHFEGAVQTAAMRAIRAEFFGEMPVGNALVLSMPPAKRYRFVVVAPTMRTPGTVANTLNAYMAFRGALVAVERHNRGASDPDRIKSVAVPGLCTGVGGMDPGIAAEQMIAAYRNVVLGYWEKVVYPAMAPFPDGPRRA